MKRLHPVSHRVANGKAMEQPAAGGADSRELASGWCFTIVGLFLAAMVGCTDPSTGPRTLTAEMPLHLEDHLDVAMVEASEVPGDVPTPLEWRFDESQPRWEPAKPTHPGREAIRPLQVEDALRLSLDETTGGLGSIFVELPPMDLSEWGHVEIRARSLGGIRYVGLNFNHDPDSSAALPFSSNGDRAPMMSDGSVQTYRLSLDSPYMRRWEGPWTHLAIWFNLVEDTKEGTLELQSVRLVPRETEFAEHGYGVRMEGRRAVAGDAGQIAPGRRSLFMHAPGQIAYQLLVPRSGRLDFALGVLLPDVSVRFSVTAASERDVTEVLFEETYADHEHWGERSVDLSHLAGRTISLSFVAESERQGAVALWATPTASGDRTTDRPNVIFYVIDGAGSDYMSAYGYNRRTTPYLEGLATEGALFERAHSNSSWTRPSTASFLTSLHHSVLGGERNGRNPVPEEVKTMAEHFHQAGYQTALLTTNPNAGRLSNLDRGNDVFRDAGLEEEQDSAARLQQAFWNWREDYPGEPYFVHFQTTDVHEPHKPPAPYSGLFISPEDKARVEELERRIEAEDLWARRAQERMGSDWNVFASGKRDRYDEAMAHQDNQILRLVERLKAEGEWDRTLLIIASDHGSAAGSQDWQTLMLDPVPEAHDLTQRGTPMLRSGVSAVPMIFVWPDRIGGGQRFSQPVSMIDVLPTALDLAGLPLPKVVQGQSLSPLLLGSKEWEPGPVILDEFEVDPETGELSGRIEVVDGRWGASLEIGPNSDSDNPGDRRPAPLLICDLWSEPLCVDSLHEERPDLVEKYTRFLEQQFRAHQDLAQLYSRPEDSPLTSEQLETLRSLGYIQ